MFDWLRRLFRRQTQKELPKPTGDSGSIIVNAEGEAVGMLFAESKPKVANKISRVDELLTDLKREREERARIPPRRRQPPTETYTREKIRGFKPKSAYSKRMWRIQVSEDELEADA